jgi:hypothetical protein
MTMATQRALAGAAHDIDHHDNSGLSYLSPHMARALRAVGLETTIVELLDPLPYPPGASEMKPLRLALEALHSFSVAILAKYGFSLPDVTSIKLHATPASCDESGSVLRTRVVITATGGKLFDSGWL